MTQCAPRVAHWLIRIKKHLPNSLLLTVSRNGAAAGSWNGKV